jgi:hypothetical protein
MAEVEEDELCTNTLAFSEGPSARRVSEATACDKFQNSLIFSLLVDYHLTLQQGFWNM